MADPRKNQTLVVVVVLLGYLFVPTLCFTTDLQHYTKEVSRRSFAIMEGMFDSESLVMRIGYPIFCIFTFVSALNQVCRVLAGLVPGLGTLIGFGGPLSMLAGFPSQEMVQARDGEEREQRLLDHVEEQVKASIVAGQSEFENELKKKKK